jgi:hypothetical protein
MKTLLIILGIIAVIVAIVYFIVIPYLTNKLKEFIITKSINTVSNFIISVISKKRSKNLK